MTDTAYFQAIQQLGRTYRSVMTAFETAIGHSMPRWRILLRLHQDGEMSQKQLAACLPMDPAALTRHIKAIEAMGWVERHNDQLDNRLTNVALTEPGRTLVEEALPRRAAFIRDMFVDLSPEQANALTELLRALESRMRGGTSN